MRQFVLLFLFVLFGTAAGAQPAVQDSLKQKLPFLEVKQNVLLNDSAGLQDFYYKLLDLQETGSEVVSVVHIGDSHIQADLFSGRVRQELHKYYGNAGRGLIFPYKVARTNEPWSYKT
ncbi:MAG: hypothetical protein LPK19_11025, partial [Hymenobacteraceae bacterium]|nr:hypothetical protein [Hymenobacteraceae bacterium]MDX5396766.1 hypothetical protein [Hymenobacteraceae bacterium]MDX5512828.1 hypothetical protein [Hymenobacteraceae bacterium]